MAEFEESLYLSKISQDIIHIVTEQQQQQQEIVAEEEIDEFGELTIGHLDDLEDSSDTEFTSELEEQICSMGMEMYHTRHDEEKRIQAELEAVARKWEMWGREESEPEPEPELEPLTELINVEQILNELLMMEKEAGFVGLGREELCS